MRRNECWASLRDGLRKTQEGYEGAWDENNALRLEIGRLKEALRQRKDETDCITMKMNLDELEMFHKILESFMHGVREGSELYNFARDMRSRSQLVNL